MAVLPLAFPSMDFPGEASVFSTAAGGVGGAGAYFANRTRARRTAVEFSGNSPFQQHSSSGSDWSQRRTSRAASRSVTVLRPPRVVLDMSVLVKSHTNLAHNSLASARGGRDSKKSPKAASNRCLTLARQLQRPRGMATKQKLGKMHLTRETGNR